MERERFAKIFLFFFVVALFFGVNSKAQSKKKSLTIRLRSVSLKKYSLKLGRNVEGKIPENGWLAKIFRKNYFFLDLDQDGLIKTDGKDGLAMEKSSFVVALPQKLLLDKGQYTLHIKPKLLQLVPENLQLPAGVFSAGGVLTEIRILAGLAPVLLHFEASLHCEWHLDYLHKNKVSSIHSESSSLTGYTPEGTKAAENSNMGEGSLAEVMQHWYRSIWHTVPILNPLLEFVGMNEKYKRCMIYFYERKPIEKKFIHPADGAIQIPCTFSAMRERPNPVPGTDHGRGCGFPIFISLPFWDKDQKIVSVVVTNLKKRKVIKGTTSSPLEPANEAWPTNSNCVLFIPAKPLESFTTYQVKFVLSVYKDPIEWVFTTGNKRIAKR